MTAKTDLIKLEFHTHPVRVFPTEDGTSFWVVVKDLADALQYSEAKDALRAVPERHKGRHFVPTPGGKQEMLCVDEAGMWRLVMRSNKPEAEPFQEWVTAEVLPAIRRTGAYAQGARGVAPATAPQPPAIDTIAHAEYVALLKSRIELLEIKARVKPKRPARPPISAEEADEMRRLAAEGFSAGRIAQGLKRSSTSVSFILRGARPGAQQ